MEFIFGLLAALSFGMADFTARFSTRSIGIYRTLFYMQVVGLVGMTLYLLVSEKFASINTVQQWQPWLFCLLAAIINIGSYIALYRAFAVGNLAVVAPIASGYAAITVALSIVTGEKVQFWQLVGIIAVLIGVVMAALEGHKDAHSDQLGSSIDWARISVMRARRLEKRRLPAGVGWALLAALGLGITFWLLGFSVTPSLGDALPIWLFRLIAILLLLPLTFITRRSLAFPRGKALEQVIGIGILDTGAFVASALGFATGNVAVVSVLTSLYSAVAVILAWLFLHERLQAVQWTGITIILAGIVLTHL